MSSSKEVAAPQTAPCPFCKEELEREDGTFGQRCDFCRKKLPHWIGLAVCPNCESPRKKSSKGIFAVACRKCDFDYTTRANLEEVSMSAQKESKTELSSGSAAAAVASTQRAVDRPTDRAAVYGATKKDDIGRQKPIQETGHQESRFGVKGTPEGEMTQIGYPEGEMGKSIDRQKEVLIQHQSMSGKEQTVANQSYADTTSKPTTKISDGDDRKRTSTEGKGAGAGNQENESAGVYQDFQLMQKNLTAIKKTKRSSPLTVEELKEISNASVQAEQLIASFKKAVYREKRIRGDEKKPKSSEKSSIECVNIMKQYLQTWQQEGTAINNAVLRYVNMVNEIAERKKPITYSQKTHHRIEFRVALSDSAKKHFSDKNIVPKIEARSNHKYFDFSKGPPLAQLSECNGIWTGVCCNIWRKTEFLEYKYRLSDSHDSWQFEFLLEDANRHITFQDDIDQVLYDGAILLKPGVRTRMYRYFFTSDEKIERQKGYPLMLPNWKAEMQRGMAVDDIVKWIGDATERMNLNFVGFKPVPCDKEKTEAKQDLYTLLMGYIKDQTIDLRGLIDDEQWLDALVASMVALLHLAVTPFPDLNPQRDLISALSALVETIFTRLGCIITDMHANKQEITHRLMTKVKLMRHYSQSVSEAMHMFVSYHCDVWIYLIPTYHLLTSASENRGTNYLAKEWWGTNEFDQDVQKFKGQKPEVEWKTWFPILKPFFQVDTVLPYTFLAMLSRKQLVHFLNYAEEDSAQVLDGIPLDGVVACVRHHLIVGNAHSFRKNLTDAFHGWLMRTKTPCWEAEDKVSSVDLAQSLLSTYHENPAKTYSRLHSEEYWRVALTSVEIQMLLATRSQYALPILTEHMRYSISVTNKWKHLMAYAYVGSSVSGNKTLSTTKALQLWEDQFLCKSGNEDIDRCWRQCCQEAFADWIKQANDPSVFAEVLFDDKREDLPEISSTLTKYLISKPHWWSVPANKKYLESPRILANISPALEEFLSDNWDVEMKQPIDLVSQMLKRKGEFVALWKFQVALLRQSNHVPQLSARSAKALSQAASTFERSMNTVIDKTVSLGDFRSLAPFQAEAIELCDIVNSLHTRRDDLSLAFQRCKAELKSFDEFTSNFTTLWQICKTSFRDPKPVDDWLHRNLSYLRFGDTVDSITLSVICELVPRSIKDILEKFCRYITHKLFHDIIIEAIRGKSTWNEIEETVNLAIERYDEVVETIQSGSINVSDLKDLQRAHFDDNKDELLKHLEVIIPDAQICRERREQISICVELEQYCNGADALLKMRDMFELTGDFADIENLSKAKEQTLQLKNISRDLMQRADVIKSITQEQMRCLKSFADSEEFVKWVRSEVQRNEITVFVDLASTVLGEDDLASHQSHNLLNALTGYTPLIYDFKRDNADLPTFLDLCKRVWQNMDSNPELPDNLSWSSSQIENFKRVKDQCGSIVMAAVSQAAAINSTGVYEIGNIRGYSKDFKTLDGVIRLTCEVMEKHGPAGEQRKCDKSYSYTELKDLQSRLALVAGDKQREGADVISQFDEMRDAVQNLANAYIEIRREGCIRYDDMMVVVHCNPKCAVPIEIKLPSIGESQTGLRAEKSVLAHCQTMHSYLTSCVRKWRQRMDHERRKNSELNYFTTEQLVVLRKELGRFASAGNSECLNQALPLLAMIHPTNTEQLQVLMAEYKQETNTGSGNSQTSQLQAYEDMTIEQQEIVEYIEEECDISRETAVAALNALDAVDIETVNEWIDQQHQKQVELANSGTDSDDILTRVVSSIKRGAPLRDRLDVLWDEFVEQTNKSIKDILGIDHLSYILYKLKHLNEMPKECRKLPWWLARGKPALIGVPGSKIYKMALTIYEVDTSFPSPTRNEVLVCTKETRKDEATLFLNRALNDPFSFYCMLNCHLLSYEVCQIIETRLSNLADLLTRDYGLAFIYAEEAKDARIKAYLDKHLSRNCPLQSDQKLREYVQQLLNVPDSFEETSCSVDPDRSFARLIRSSRAGTGKSLQKKNLCRALRNTHIIRGKDITICLHKTIKTDSIIDKLTKELGHDGTTAGEQCHTIHLDIAHEVESGVDELLFNLIILGSLVNSEGVVWQAKQTQYYIIECMPFTDEKGVSVHNIVDLLPTLECITPQEALERYQQNPRALQLQGIEQNTQIKANTEGIFKNIDDILQQRSLFQRTPHQTAGNFPQVQLKEEVSTPRAMLEEQEVLNQQQVQQIEGGDVSRQREDFSSNKGPVDPTPAPSLELRDEEEDMLLESSCKEIAEATSHIGDDRHSVLPNNRRTEGSLIDEREDVPPLPPRDYPTSSPAHGLKEQIHKLRLHKDFLNVQLKEKEQLLELQAEEIKQLTNQITDKNIQINLLTNQIEASKKAEDLCGKLSETQFDETDKVEDTDIKGDESWAKEVENTEGEGKPKEVEVIADTDNLPKTNEAASATNNDSDSSDFESDMSSDDDYCVIPADLISKIKVLCENYSIEDCKVLQHPYHWQHITVSATNARTEIAAPLRILLEEHPQYAKFHVTALDRKEERQTHQLHYWQQTLAFDRETNTYGQAICELIVESGSNPKKVFVVGPAHFLFCAEANEKFKSQNCDIASIRNDIRKTPRCRTVTMQSAHSVEVKVEQTPLIGYRYNYQQAPPADKPHKLYTNDCVLFPFDTDKAPKVQRDLKDSNICRDNRLKLVNSIADLQHFHFIRMRVAVQHHRGKLYHMVDVEQDVSYHKGVHLNFTLDADENRIHPVLRPGASGSIVYHIAKKKDGIERHQPLGMLIGVKYVEELNFDLYEAVVLNQVFIDIQDDYHTAEIQLVQDP